MSSRQYAQQQRQQMRESLLQKYRDGQLRSGEVLPSVRELAKQFDLSTKMAHNVLREMGDEGLVQRKRGAGIYMSHLPEHTFSTFAAVFGDEFGYGNLDWRMVREGFEAEIAQRSSNNVILTPKTHGLSSVLQNLTEGQLKMAGALLVPSYELELQIESKKIIDALGNIPFVVHNIEPFSLEDNLPGINYDTVRFDDFEGGRQAVRHLWKRGHRQIAFLGLNARGSEKTKFLWSLRREKGFLAAINELGGAVHIFQPVDEAALSYAERDQRLAAEEAAFALMPLLRDGKVKAVVCVNHFALAGLAKALRQFGMPESKWPAIVAFDDWANGDHLLSVLSLPWEELGRAAAVALWERVFGTEAQRQAPQREILVPMRLIARLSCAENYPTMAVADAVFSHL